jgi:hypothetical protein
MSDEQISPAETPSNAPQAAPAPLVRVFKPQKDITAYELAEVVYKLGIMFPEAIVPLSIDRHFGAPGPKP